MNDSLYEAQMLAAKFRAERDAARQEVKELREELDAASKDAAERSKILEAARWVRDHGGLAHIMDIVNDFRAVVERIGVEWSESELHTIMGVLDSRLLPERMEWPRYDTGEKVELGCQIATPNGGGEVCGIEFDTCGICALHTEGVNGEELAVIDLDNGERVKLPKPDPIGADGLPIKHGDTVYELGKVKPIIVDFVDYVDRYASGYYVGTGARVYHLKPEHLTHDDPCDGDSWERISLDALSFVEDNALLPHDQDQMERDILWLIRRAKALAEKED